MLMWGWDGSSRAIGGHIMVIVVSSIAYVGVLSMPEQSLALLDVRVSFFIPPSHSHPSPLIHVPAHSSLPACPALLSITLLLHSLTPLTFSIVIIVLLGIIIVWVVVCSLPPQNCRCIQYRILYGFRDC